MIRSTRPARLAAVVVLVLSSLVAVLPVGAQESEPLPEDPYARLAEVRRRQAEAALAVDLLTASHAEVQARLEIVEAWLVAQERVVAARQAELAEAGIALAAARRREEAKAAERDQLEALMVEIAVQAYMRPPSQLALEVVVNHDLASAEKADVMLRAKTAHDVEVADALARAEAQLRRLRLDAQHIAERAEAAADDAAEALSDLAAARDEQADLATRIVAELDATSSEIETLGTVEVEAAEAVRQQTSVMLARARRTVGVTLADVRGIRVHSDIAPAIEGLLALAEADGIILRGWGHRSTEQQIALRLQHCGGPDVSPTDAVYTVPAGQCSPPTAKPGTSMHELGLAIDFTHDGASIGSHASPAYQWLAEHAADFGLRNLPSEPWHWSIDGS